SLCAFAVPTRDQRVVLRSFALTPFTGVQGSQACTLGAKERRMMLVSDEPTYLTVPEIAARQRVSESLVKRALTSGALKGHQVGEKKRWRIAVEDYRDWVARGAPSSKQRQP